MWGLVPARDLEKNPVGKKIVRLFGNQLRMEVISNLRELIEFPVGEVEVDGRVLRWIANTRGIGCLNLSLREITVTGR